MPLRVVKYQETPNPNALKCVLDRAVAPESRSYFSAASAAGDPLATALFAIPGVRNLLFHDTWVTIGKAPEADWRTIKSAAEKALAQAP